ncbi:MAG: CoA transferase [Chloroflexota bacterium]|nr:CoA transferase [Chloroflexota bacterium]
MAARPLAGITILDFTRVYSGPYATLLLADMGARVIKVEHPDYGDDSRSFGPAVENTSGYFETLNRGKQSIAVDYRTSEGQGVLRRIAANIDVVIENFRPAQMARYGLDYDCIATQSPRAIYVSISGYGQTGANAPLKCYDVVAQAVSGLMSLTGLPNLPIKSGAAIADAITGLTAAVGLLGALVARERTGIGRYVDVAMVDSVFACLENALAHYSVTGDVLARHGNRDPVIAPFDCFQTADNWIAIGVGNDRLWRLFAGQIRADLVEDARFSTNADRVVHYDALQPIIAGWCSTQSTDVLLERLHAVGVPCGAIRAMDELAHDSHLEARGMLAKLRLVGDTEIVVPGAPIHFRDTDVPSYVRAPLLGEHTCAVLSDAGYSSAAIDVLISDRIAHQSAFV